jgi:hypothetical protein
MNAYQPERTNRMALLARLQVLRYSIAQPTDFSGSHN